MRHHSEVSWPIYLDGLRVRVMHLNQWTVAGIKRHLHSNQRFQAVRIGHSHGTDLKPEAPGRSVNVKGVFNDPFLSS